MKKLVITLLAAALFSFTGCLSGKYIIEPREGRETLLIGHIKMKVYGFDFQKGVNSDSIIGAGDDFAEGVVLRVKNLSTEKIYDFAAKLTGSDYGMIINHRLPPGRYSLIECNARTRALTGGYYYDFWFRATNYYEFVVVEGQVNNLGTLIVHFNRAKSHRKWNGDENIYTAVSPYEKNSGYLEVQTGFEEHYPESLWNESEWREVFIGDGNNSSNFQLTR